MGQHPVVKNRSAMQRLGKEPGMLKEFPMSFGKPGKLGMLPGESDVGGFAAPSEKHQQAIRAASFQAVPEKFGLLVC